MTDVDPTPNTTDEPPVDPLPVASVATLCEELAANVARVIVGHDDVVEHVVTAILGRGHVLLEDVPGVGKTMLARSIATSIDCSLVASSLRPTFSRRT